jgi:hypothetical protein
LELAAELAAEDAATDTLLADAGLPPVQLSADRFTIADDQEILFLPDGPSRPTADLESPVNLDDPTETDDPFSIPDHTRVVPHRGAWQIGLGPGTGDEATDPELRSGLSEEERTDPGAAAGEAVPMSMDDPAWEPEGLPLETGPAPLVPMPAPQDVRLDVGATSPAPARMTPAPEHVRMPPWLAAGLLLAAIAVGAAIAVALRL